MNKTPAPRKILLVDDEETIRNAIGIDLRQENFAVDLAKNGDIAFALLAKSHYDLVITDLAMPRITGLEILQEAKRLDPKTSVIILTGYADLESSIKALRLGADDYLQKPCDYDELLLRVRRCFEKQDLLCELTATNQELAESEAMKELLLQSASEGIFGFDCKGKMIFINASAEKMLGYTKDELLGDNRHALIHHSNDDGSFYPKEKCQMLQTVLQQKTVHIRDEVLWRKDGTSFPVEYKSSPLWHYGQVIGVVVIFSDISDQKSQEKEREQLSAYLQQMEKFQSLNSLAGGIAHNFNNILTSVLGNLELTLLTLPPETPERSFIENSFTSAKRAAQLSTKMLQFVGQCKTDRQDLDLSSIVQESVEALRSQLDDKIELVCSCGKELFILGDCTLIKQTIINLITNAFESIGDEYGKISLRTGKKHFSETELQSPHTIQDLPAGEYVFIEVTDSGKGMKEETLKRAFEPFFSEKFTGRGMGLATVLGIMRIHSGTIFVKTMIGKGTTVQTLFPASMPKKETQKSREKTNTPSENKGKILMADDTPEILEIGKELLKFSGYSVITAEDGREALELFKKNKQDIILALLDVSMPYMDGIEVCRAIRKTSDTPIIMVTAYSIREIAHNFPETTGIDFLQKPFTGTTLNCKIEGMLSQ